MRFSTSFGVQIGVITTDNKFVFAQRSRSNATATSAGKWTCGCVETMSVLDGFDPHRTAARGLKEEINLDATPSDVKMLIVYLKTDVHEAGAGGVVDYREVQQKAVAVERKQFASIPEAGKVSISSEGRGLSSAKVQQEYHLASDKHESVQLAFVPFQPLAMARWMMYNDLSTATPAVVIAILKQYFKSDDLVEAFSLTYEAMPDLKTKANPREAQAEVFKVEPKKSKAAPAAAKATAASGV